MKPFFRQPITTNLNRSAMLLFVLLSCLNFRASATIATTVASSTICTNYASIGAAPLWTSLGTISLRETAGDDMGNVSGSWSATITLAAPAGWQFNSAVNPILAYTANKNVTSVVRGAFTSTSLTFTINGSNKNKKDKVTITGLQVQPTTTSPLLSYIKPSAVTGTISGVSTSTNFAKLTPSSPVGGAAGVAISTSPSASVCSGTSVTFSAGVTNGGATPAYQWQLNGSNISGATAATYSSSALANGSAITCSVTSYSCIATPTATSAATTLTVNSMPAAITGSTTVCVGASTTFTNSSAGTWSSSNIDIANVDMTSGIVSGGAAGTATITFTTTGGCTATKAVTVNAAPGTINGTTTLCSGTTSTLTSTGTATWSSSATSVATVNASGVVTGVTGGTANIIRTASNGCAVSATVTVNTAPANITGTASVCAGSATTLGNTVAGGAWTSSNTAAATVASGVVAGVAAGTTVISYAMSSGCAKSVIVTVYATPAVIGGASSVCKSSTTTLTQTSTGGTWACNPTSVAIIGASTGALTGAAQGTATISYSFATGCRTTKVVSVAVAPAAIAGGSSLCSGSTIALTNTSLYGTWSSNNTSVATVSGGVVTGGSNGTATISYTTGCGTSVGKVVTVSNSPITGSYTVCTGYTTTLADASAGGTWSSGNAAVAAVSAAGVVSGVSGGTATISYANGSCTASVVVTVNIAPSVITGSTVVCQGSSTTLFNTTPYGSWISDNSSIAAVEAASGVVTGLTEGATVITYNTGCGSASSATVTVNVVPDAIVGISPVCVGSSISITSSGGGTWSSSNASVATVDAAGLVTGITSGTSNVTYTLPTGCDASGTVTVNALPSMIGGTTSVCIGSTTTLTSGTGGAWSSSNAAIATVGTNGVVTGVAEGTAVISYTLSTGCGKSVIVTVNALPAAITGTFTVCPAATTTLTSSAGGTWISSMSGVATVNSSTGVVTGVAAGTSNITYTLSTGCKATKQITVNSLPASITGTLTACTGATRNLADATAGGTWSSCNTTVAIIGSTGVVSGVAPGTAVIRYILPTGCKVTTTVTINTVPSAGAISGESSVCLNDAEVLTSTVSGGTWSVSDANVVDMDASTGEAFGLAAGNVTVTYTVANACATSYTTAAFAVSEFPTVNATTGAASVCEAATTTLSNTTTGGVWSSVDASIVAVDASTGFVTGVAAGISTISYAITNVCGTVATTKVLSVNPLPSVAAIAGIATVCPSATTVLSNATAGGAWSSSDPSVATVAGGAVTGVATGTTTISYVVTNGCGSAVATQVVTVGSLPNAGSIAASTSVCEAATARVTSTVVDGVWGISNESVATVSDGVVTGVAAGSATVSYSISNSCGTSVVTGVVTVEAAPSAIAGLSYVQIGGNTTLSNTVVGGTWTSSNPSAATVDAAGVVTGIASGSAVITYSVSNVCGENSVTKSLPVGVLGTWLGGSSANWNDAGNWFGGVVPNDTISVSVAAGTTYAPAISAAVSVKNVTVASGAILAIASNTLNVKGNIYNQSVVSGNGVIVMNGTTPQTIGGNGKFSNLTIANNTSVTTNDGDTLSITGTLLLNAGTLTTNGRLMLVSTATVNGRIGTITGGAVVGNVIAQQYFAGRRAWRMVGHPFSTSIPLSALTPNIDVTGAGGAANGFTPTTTNEASCFWFNQYVTAGVFNSNTDPGWQAFTSAYGTTSANLIKQYQPVRLFTRGGKGEGLTSAAYTASAATVRMTGEVNTGNQVLIMHKGTAVNASTGLSTQDFNFLANPYPSPVNLGAVVKNAYDAGLIRGTAFFVWNPYLGTNGAFVTVPIDGTPYYIPANSAFVVRVNNDNTTLNFTEAHKGAATTASLLKTKSDYLTLNIYDESYHQYDALSVQFNDKATTGEDMHDAVKIADMADLNFYTLADRNAPLAIDARPFTAGKTIPLGIRSNYAQEFIIRAESLAVPAGSRVVLHDKYLGKRTQLTQGAECRFQITADEKSQGEKRFELIMDPGEVNETVATVTNMNVTVSPNPATENVAVTYVTAGNAEVNATIANISGEVVAHQQLGNSKNGSAKFNIKNLPAGIYMVTIVCGSERMTEQLVKE